MTRFFVLVFATLSAAEATAIVAVPGNVRLSGAQRVLEPLVPKFERCGAKKIIFNRNGPRSTLFVDQNPKDTAIFACVKRVARNVRWQVQVNFGEYGRYEI